MKMNGGVAVISPTLCSVKYGLQLAKHQPTFNANSHVEKANLMISKKNNEAKCFSFHSIPFYSYTICLALAYHYRTSHFHLNNAALESGIGYIFHGIELICVVVR